MDSPLFYLLLSKVDVKFYYIVPIIICLIIFNGYDKIKEIMINFRRHKKNIRFYVCTESTYVFTNYYFPKQIIALNDYMINNNIKAPYSYYNIDKNGVDEYNVRYNKIELSSKYFYVVASDVRNLNIIDDIYLTIDVINLKRDKEKLCLESKKIVYYLESEKANIDEFLRKCEMEYEEKIEKRNKNKTYHFIYNGCRENENKRKTICFTSNLLCDYDSKYNLNETFDHLFSVNKEIILNDLKKLRDLEYYKKTGMKRKKSYLFYGIPGCGKTAFVMAISNYDKRHIIEIPLNRVKTNEEFEKIMAIETIDDVKIRRSEVIYLFDEIDIDTDGLDRDKKERNVVIDKKEVNEKSEDFKEKCKIIEKIENPDKLSLGTLLSRFDGIGNYDGVIIIATTNKIESLDKALYRDMRLTPMLFEYCRKEDIIDMIEDYYKVKLTEFEKIRVPDNKKITPASLKVLIEQHKKYEDLLSNISNKTEIKVDITVDVKIS
jgi:hypothetical protein